MDALGCDVLVSDDGFQHFTLRRETDVVVIDEELGTANHWCLPAGPLREPISSLDRAHVVVANGNPDRTCRQKGVLGMQVQVRDAKNLATDWCAHSPRFGANRCMRWPGWETRSGFSGHCRNWG